MAHQRLGCLARPDEAHVLSNACLIAGAVIAVTVLFPFSPTAPRRLGAELVVVAFALGLALRWAAPRLRSVHLHAVLGLSTALIALCVAASTTPSGTLITSVSFLWVATFSAVFHRRRVLLRHLGLIGIGLGVGLLLAGAPSVPQTWFFLMATFSSVTVILNGKIRDLRAEATTDPLTGVLTRRAFRAVAELEMARAARTKQPLTLVLLDLDDFKLVNDERGHDAGDAVLVSLTAAWREGLRAEDALGRFGGDEFLLVLPGADEAQARDLLPRLRDDSICSWSAGLATWRGESFDDWFRAADQELYAVKST